WTGHDLPDVPKPTDGPDTPNGQRAFHLNAEGVGRLFAAVYEDPDPKHSELPRDASYVPKDGPLPEMYEPVESPFECSLHPQQPDAQVSPSGEPPPDRHGRQVPARAHDLDRRRTLVLRFDHTKRLVADR